MPLLVVVAAWVGQGACLRNGWVWDDAILVRDGHEVARGLEAVPSLLLGTWGGGEGADVGLYRPLVGASLAVQASIHGVGDPFPFHVVNLFLHGLVAILYLRLLDRLLPDRPVATSAAALLFAVHPLHTGTVSWIVARGDLLAALFSVLAALAWTRPRGLDATAAVLAAVLWFLALLSKEMALALPAALLVLDAAPRAQGLRRALAARGWSYALLLLPLGGYLLLRSSATGGLLANAPHAPLGALSLPERLFVAAGALVRMAATVAVPAGLTGDRSDDPVLLAHADLPVAYAVAAGAVLLVALGILVRRLGGRGGLVAACLVLFAVLALPVLQIVPIGAVFEDRFAYLPSLALLPVLGLAAERLAATRRPAVGISLAALALAALVPAAWATAATWHDDDAFDRALLERNPEHLKAIDRLARRRLAEGLALRHDAERTPPSERGRIQALHAAGNAAIEESVRLLERARATGLGRNHPGILRSLADGYSALRVPRFEDAERVYFELLRVKRVREDGRWVPAGQVKDVGRVLRADREAIAQIQENLARAENGIDRDDRLRRVAEAYDRAAIWDPPPGRYDRQRLAGTAWTQADEPARALVRLRAAAEVAPPEAREAAQRTVEEVEELARTKADEALRRGTAALERPDAHREAQREFEEALRYDPERAAAHVGMARVKRYMGDLRGALDELAAASRLLDARHAPADDPLRRQVEDLRRRYEGARDAPGGN